VLVRREDAAQMALVEDDEVVETLAPDRPDDSLDIRIGQSCRIQTVSQMRSDVGFG
jgi:hypothetical protein